MAQITEEWLAEVGFKYREPTDRQPFRHWKLRFSEPEDYGLYIETTMGGWINGSGEHVFADSGWFLWIGRAHCFLHVRHVSEREEIVALVEALSGQPWEPSKIGLVPVRDSHAKPDHNGTSPRWEIP